MHRRRFALLGILGLTLTPVSCESVARTEAQAGPALRTESYEYIADGKRYGYRNLEVTRTEDGNYRYRVETRMKIDLFGQQKQESTSREEYVVTPDLRPVSIQIDSKDMTGVSRLKGRVVDGCLKMDVHRAGQDRVVELPLDERNPPIFAVCVVDKLLAVPASQSGTTLHQIQDENGPAVLRATRMKGASTGWELDTGLGFGTQRMRFDGDRLVETHVDYPPLHVRRVDEKVTGELEYRVMDGREVLTFPVDKSIGPLERVRKLAVELRWNEIPLSDLHLEDARQKVVRHDVKGDEHRVLLQLTKPPQIAAGATLPVTDVAMAPYLAETDFVKPKHPDIVAAARKAVGGEKDAAKAARALTKWVFEYIEGQLAAGTLTGPEVLACRRGKCTEYSTLYASLARAVGIPTRMALGERLMGTSWMGHMWNEVWVGRWVTVDATVDEFDHSFALLKFVHSDTVMGTQPVRWKLTSSLAISVDSVDRVASALEKRFKTGLVGNTYTNTDAACRITAPEGWEMQDQTKPGVVTVRFRHKDAKSAFVHLVAFAVPAGTKPKQILDGRKAMFTGSYDDFEIVESKACDVAGAPAHMWRHRGKPKSNSKVTNGTVEYVWIRGKRGFLMNMITLDKSHDADRAIFEALRAKFEFLD